MEDPTYRRTVGALDCTFLIDGYHNYENFASRFVGASRSELETALKRHGIDIESWEIWRNAYPVLLVRSEGRTVLVDTGAGSFDPETGRLQANLAAIGVSAGEIDTVIVTHAHPDHAGGTLSLEGGPAFPRARYLMWRREWQFWMSEECAGRAKEGHIAYARKQLGPIEARVDLIEPPARIAPGLTVLAGPGHTPGQLMVELESGGERLLSVADVVIHPVQMEHPDWTIDVEVEPDRVPVTRRQVLDRAARENLLLHVPHFDFPGLGYVGGKGNAWSWMPVGG